MYYLRGEIFSKFKYSQIFISKSRKYLSIKTNAITFSLTNLQLQYIIRSLFYIYIYTHVLHIYKKCIFKNYLAKEKYTLLNPKKDRLRPMPNMKKKEV
jgi:hypothetical protein